MVYYSRSGVSSSICTRTQHCCSLAEAGGGISSGIRVEDGHYVVVYSKRIGMAIGVAWAFYVHGVCAAGCRYDLRSGRGPMDRFPILYGTHRGGVLLPNERFSIASKGRTRKTRCGLIYLSLIGYKI